MDAPGSHGQGDSADRREWYEKPRAWVFLVGGVIVLLFLNGIIGILLADWGHLSAFGDLFGAANALFAGLAFAGLVLALFLQRRELELQREELTLTRQELQRSADAQEQIAEAQRRSEDALVRQSELMAEQAGTLEETARLTSQGLIPAVSCVVLMRPVNAGWVNHLIVQNGGGLAFDLEVDVLASYHLDQIRNRFRFREGVLAKDGEFTLEIPGREVPPELREQLEVRFPTPQNLQILIQYQAASEQSFCQMFVFERDEYNRFHLSRAYPRRPVRNKPIGVLVPHMEEEYPAWVKFEFFSDRWEIPNRERLNRVG